LACCGNPKRTIIDRLIDQGGGSQCVLKCTDKFKVTDRCNAPRSGGLGVYSD
jgi:hypothetical protein